MSLWVETADARINATPVVSVLVLTFNHESFLSTALESILSQEETGGIEVLIGDDSSIDNTLAVALRFQASHPTTVRVFHRTTNGGMLENFRNLYSSARGEFFAVCEGDDYWTNPRKLAKQLQLLRAESPLVMSYHDAAVVSTDGATVWSSKIQDYWGKAVPPRTTTPQELAAGAAIPLVSIFARRIGSIALPTRSDKVLNLDTVLFALLGEHGEAAFLDEKLAAYRIHEGGIWSSSTVKKQKQGQTDSFRFLVRHIDRPRRCYACKTYCEYAIGFAAYCFVHLEVIGLISALGDYLYGILFLATDAIRTPTARRYLVQSLLLPAFVVSRRLQRRKAT